MLCIVWVGNIMTPVFDRVEQGRFQMQPFAVDQSKVLIRLNLDAVSLTDAFGLVLDTSKKQSLQILSIRKWLNLGPLWFVGNVSCPFGLLSFPV